jgi:hypothetical protein
LKFPDGIDLEKVIEEIEEPCSEAWIEQESKESAELLHQPFHGTASKYGLDHDGIE